MEDRVEIAREFHELDIRRGTIHRNIEELFAKMGNVKIADLETLDLQSLSFYKFFNSLYEWYIDKKDEESATNFWIPNKGNPMLAATYSPQRRAYMEKRDEETREMIQSDEWSREMFLEGWLSPERPKEKTNELFADSLQREVPFYLGHILCKGIQIAIKQKTDKNYSSVLDEIFKEEEILERFIQNRDKYARAILEKER